MNTHDERIRRRAYELWEEAGRTGDPQQHWLRAERELGECLRERAATELLRRMVEKLRAQLGQRGREAASGNGCTEIDREDDGTERISHV